MENWKKGLVIGLFSSMLLEQHAVAASVGLKRADATVQHRTGLAMPLLALQEVPPYPAATAKIEELWQERAALAWQPFVPAPEADVSEGIASRLVLAELDVHEIGEQEEAEEAVLADAQLPKLASRSGVKLPPLVPPNMQEAVAERPAPAQEVQPQAPQGSQPVSSPAPTLQPGSGAVAPQGGKAVAVAMQYQGVPYRYGGTTPGGFDCSGFIQFVYQQLGVELPRTTYAQLGAGVQVSQANLQPGDLIFFSCGGVATSHAGIYIGNGQFIHADADRGIMVAALDNPYWSGVYQTAVRI
ncbi:cell wall-associated NlpC family hydrolase [Tumebacillus sp. BK434]|uniref:C40 family peptidase n=1 Tax=Tumebacillus sp. BK434 TaxID=2512169 RepID=UPI0010DD53F0|nr:C40 family peptidase [Tumebacillus sp. BK434]TCP55451.1 cell wall-associated NlpC family hydrolase [Tumebacillus sp. BK434]